jgi:CPA2 family monovalent cation:H+ antiporter-2
MSSLRTGVFSVQSFNFVHDFSLILIMAGLAAIVAKSLRIPLLLGYIIGGVVLNIPVGGSSIIHNQGLIHQLSELGIAFLMFYAGLEFDLSKLRQLFGSVILALFFQTFFMILLGRVVAPLLGWGGLNGLFLGGLLAISSTMITLPVLAEQKALKTNFAQLSIGVLVFEDILAIMLLVILSGISITGHLAWDAVGKVTFLVGTFVVAVFFVGRMIAPSLIRQLMRLNSDEVVTMVSVALLLSIGFLAEHAQFSIALGAFLAGAILSKSELATSIEEHTHPIQTLFSAIFFISIGLMIHPANLLHHWATIVILTLLVFFLKGIACFLGLFVSGQNGEDSLKAALSKSQIGEFSFVIASLGASAHVVDSALLDIAVGVSIGTIICTSIASPNAGRIYKGLIRMLPNAIIEVGDTYHAMMVLIRSRVSQNVLLKIAIRPVIHILINLLLFAALLSLTTFSVGIISEIKMPYSWLQWINLSIWAGLAIISSFFLTPTVRQVNVLLFALINNALPKSKEISQQETNVHLGAIFQSVIFAIFLLIFGGAFLSVSSPYLPHGSTLVVFIILLMVSAIFLWRRIGNLNSRVEHYFISTFNRDLESQLEKQRHYILRKFKSTSPLAFDVREVTVYRSYTGCGARISELGIRTKFAVTIVAIRRGGYTAFSPYATTQLFPGDVLILTGKQESLQQAAEFFNTPLPEDSGHPMDMDDEFEMEQICVPLKHELIGKTLMECNLRQSHGVDIIGIQRNQKTIDSPTGGEVLLANDVLVVVGGKSAVARFHDLLSQAPALS